MNRGTFSLFAALAPGAVLFATEVAPIDAAHALPTRKHQGIPSIAVSKVNGRMWSTFYADPMGGENHLNYCVLTTSSDDGRTWKEVLYADPDGTGLTRAFDPEVWISPDGVLRWTWAERTADPGICLTNAWNGGSGQHTDVLVGVELDAEREPSPPYPPCRRLLKGVMMCKPTVVASGDWVYPLCEWFAAPSTRFYATRDGRSFRYLGGVVVPKKWRLFDEGQFVERRDGAWRVLLRNKNGLCESTSTDKGLTWPEAAASNLGHPSARLFFTRLPSGNLLLVKHGRVGEALKERKELRAFVSTDDGLSWKGGLLIDGRVNVSYPDGDVDRNGRIVIVYDRERRADREVLFARFTEKDATAGDDKAPGVELRRVISRSPN
ncbi:MAG: exo-alpha-sialidase [Kiritimatiellae bacterium]|nr:exo-alpha-sialidase [Kiritimatiellia bacterium]